MPYGSLNQRKGNHGFSSNFPDKQTDIVTYRGAVCDQKGSPRVHRIMEDDMQEIKGRLLVEDDFKNLLVMMRLV